MTAGRAAYLRAAAAAVIAAVIFAFSWLYRFNDPGGSFAYLTDDHFFYLVRGWQILFGDLPVRDFVDHGAPLYFYVAWAVQQAFGRGTLSEIVFSVTILAACSAGVFLLAARVSSLLFAFGAAAMFTLLEPRLYNYPKALVYIAAIAALWSFADRPDRWRVTLLAAVTAIGFLFRHDHGVFVAAAFVALLLLMRLLSWRDRVRHALTFGVLVLLMLAPYLVFIQRHGGLDLYVRTAIEWAERDRARAEVAWPGLFDNPDGVSRLAVTGDPPERALAIIRDNSVAWFYYCELALPLVAIAALALSRSGGRPAWPNAAAKVGVVAVLAVLLDAGFLRSPLAARLADPSVPIVILCAWLPGALVSTVRAAAAGGSPARIAGVSVTLVAGLALIALMIVAVTRGTVGRLQKTGLDVGIDAALDQAAETRQRIGRAFPVTLAPGAKAGDLMTLAVYLRECTAPTDRVFMQHYVPQVLALAERGFAGGHADLRPGFFTSDAMQRLTVDRLRRQSVPLALVGEGQDLGGFRESFPIVVTYLDAQYRTAGERTFDGRFPMRLLVRRDAKAVRRFAPLGWPCFR